MARFIVHPHPRRKKLEEAYQYFLIVFTVLGIMSLFYFDWDGGGRRAVNLILFLFLFWSAIDRLRRKKKEHFLKINEDHLEWLISEQEEKTRVPWNDIRWIKKEKDGGITLFQDSSFSKHFPLNGFTEDDATSIYKLIQETAIQKEIRLINFAGVISAVA